MRRVLPVAAALFLLTACGSGVGKSPSPAGGSAVAAAAQDVVSTVPKVDRVAALLPEETRKAGTLKLGGSTGTPPSAFYPDPAVKKAAGIDVDFTDAVAKVLGITIVREEAAFEAILPALGSGKYDLGAGNFGVTEARLKTIDFVTYVNDGQGFSVKKDNTTQQPVKEIGQLCGLTIGTGVGTTFETTLNAKKNICTDAGKKAYEVRAYSEAGATLTSLQQGKVDLVMSTINGLRYQESQPASGTRFLSEFRRLDVGFAFKKGSPLTPAFQAAVNQLIQDGTYQKILQKWGTTGSAITKSEISPPERP
ncbi:ABC transporter substrate-binding protein [Kitasatospora sp. NPDC002040]|uniref:ABC transporter substrate-binding protein n=1 Tax=Kitasatospora sp. NPDC002040 TaxID=3154661 RepID=UPI00332624BA